MPIQTTYGIIEYKNTTEKHFKTTDFKQRMFL